MLPAALIAQTPPAAAPPPAAGTAQAPEGRGAAQGRGAPGQGRGPNFPQQQRPLADAAVLARGKGLYESSCAACHGIDLRGGQQGGPNLLRSQTLLSDKAGELDRADRDGRPAQSAGRGAADAGRFRCRPADITAIAEYLHSVLGQAGNQGRPPEGETGRARASRSIGNAAAGQSYVASRCASCHSVADLQDCGRARHRPARSAEPMGLGRRGWRTRAGAAAERRPSRSPSR